MRIVVLGGYGNFGARICRALAERSGAQIIAAGRDPDGSRLPAGIGRAKLDLGARNFAGSLADLSPSIVVHCAGPFQGQGYHVAEAALLAGAHYIDLADGRDFVANFAERMNKPARAAGVLAVSGASTLPALSSAVVDSVARRLDRVDEIRIVIAPAQRGTRGTATLAGVVSYAGKPFKWLSGGQWVDAYGWQELRRAGFDGLRSRWSAACDVPDLALLPARYPGVGTVEFRAALELRILHLGLWCAAALRRRNNELPLERWVLALGRVVNALNVFGSDRGGMSVSVAGTRHDGSRARIEWHLTAESNHGPEIPCMAAIMLAQKLAQGEIATRGAFPCMGFLALPDFEAEFKRWNIATVVREGPA
ncbi:MAG: saccharopine dehydrogenase [Betaproteobacteria bacterium]|nr:saccharopine dehydrogenase [Betaproteobacteria bacterium]